VMRARISELNAKIDALNIEIDKQITLARLNYYAAAKDNQINAAQSQGASNE
ncbi:MAG: transporter, partial [Pseudomonadota bacterium]|nr:transporter [Pseudomonadota bacterium]